MPPRQHQQRTIRHASAIRALGCRCPMTKNPLRVLTMNATDEEPDVFEALKNCTFIYAPKGQAGEYAARACNPYRGCGHGCNYCYVPLILHMKRPEFDAGAIPRPDFLHHLRK